MRAAYVGGKGEEDQARSPLRRRVTAVGACLNIARSRRDERDGGAAGAPSTDPRSHPRSRRLGVCSGRHSLAHGWPCKPKKKGSHTMLSRDSVCPPSIPGACAAVMARSGKPEFDQDSMRVHVILGVYFLTCCHNLDSFCNTFFTVIIQLK